MVQATCKTSDQVTLPPVTIFELNACRTLRVLLLPDLHIPFGEAQKKLLLSKRDFLDAHDWVLLLGDMTACYGTPGEYRQVNRFIRSLDRPYSVVNGNHEFCFLPVSDTSSEYGKKWQAGPPEIQQQQLSRFEEFFGIDSRFQAGSHPLAGLCLLGMDQVGANDTIGLRDNSDLWFEETLNHMQDETLLIFSHFPISDDRLDNIRYYAPGRRPYYQPSTAIERALQKREHPTFWFSGHLHFGPSHPLAKPYLTRDGVCQVHCPDGWGYGRPNNDKWTPEHYTGLFVRSVLLAGRSVTVITTDLLTGREIARHEFDRTAQTVSQV